MRIYGLLLVALLPMMGYANNADAKFGKKDLVGSWTCVEYAKDDELAVSGKALQTFYDDGTMFQLWDLVKYKSDNISTIELLIIKNRWDYSPDKGIKIYDFDIQDNRIYNTNKVALSEEERNTARELLQTNYEKPRYTNQLTFMDKDNFMVKKLSNGIQYSRCKRVV